MRGDAPARSGTAAHRGGLRVASRGYLHGHSGPGERLIQSGLADRLDDLLARHGTKASLAKEAVAGTVATVAGFAHMTAGDEVLKNVLAAIGFKAYEISSCKVLIVLAETVGAAQDVAVLEQSMKEEQEMGDWLGSHLPDFVHAYLKRRAA